MRHLAAILEVRYAPSERDGVRYEDLTPAERKAVYKVLADRFGNPDLFPVVVELRRKVVSVRARSGSEPYKDGSTLYIEVYVERRDPLLGDALVIDSMWRFSAGKVQRYDLELRRQG